MAPSIFAAPPLEVVLARAARYHDQIRREEDARVASERSYFYGPRGRADRQSSIVFMLHHVVRSVERIATDRIEEMDKKWEKAKKRMKRERLKQLA